MGGSEIPWKKAFMNYRAWQFKTMQANVSSVPEPEAAGSMAWVLYNAYNKTQNKEYLKASEWAMEFLNEWQTNPSYELQLPYGVYTAARMNAELTTNYDVEKMVNWCFDKGPLRGWGAIKGSWGGLNVSGLIGEANDNGDDYAFQMNGLHQAAMLVPMTRYDKRFAKAIGKWVLNLANANRLYYPGFLPSSNQDASAWSSQYDADQVIGYEALRQVYQGKSPFSTGDAVKGGWAATNLALYGTSSIGYLGSIIEKTNVQKVLKLDLLKTDFFRESAYPSFLLYNPLTTNAEVNLKVGTTSTDIYESLQESFIQTNAIGDIIISIPAGEVVMIVFCPANGTISYDKNKMLVNGIVVDYTQHKQSFKYSPRIKSLASEHNPVQQGKSTTIFCTAQDKDSAALTYSWSANTGTFNGSSETVEFTAPLEIGPIEIQCIVNDSENNSDTSQMILEVVEKINSKPEILHIDNGLGYVSENEDAHLTCIATDVDGDALTYSWNANGGSFNGSGNTVTWSSPTEGIYDITVTVTDTEGASTEAVTKILVKQFANASYKPLAYYPFTGNTLDLSGNNLHGQAKGALLTNDKDGISQNAYYFNGGAQHISVTNDDKLNFTNSITVCAWIKPVSLPEKESFVLSHGSWQNRWKISITPDKHLRWTVNTLQGVSDLDAMSTVANDEFTHVCATYDQDIMAVYINGSLENYKKQSGNIRTTSYPFLVGQMLPDNAEYNFKGVIDEVVIMGASLSPEQVNNIYSSGITSTIDQSIIEDNIELTVTPNPSSSVCRIILSRKDIEVSKLVLIDINGRMQNIHVMKEQGTFVADISSLIPGLYHLWAITSDRVFSCRLLKI